ncbi:uncharacterized protein LOC141590333 [Silene latifolia]|uniref:uncharacterized protein LOC141590333 n=1 Tax=Silene latifolia TaxID=37657 RepID=UPI003D78A842
MSTQANVTLLALIPKKPVMATVMDYRTIACCTVFYKTVSKILCARLKPCLSQIVGKEQGAFVQGRNIFVNIMLTQSLVKGYGQKWVSPRCLIKVDIKKAFYSLQWEFINKMFQGDIPSVAAVTQALDSFVKMSGLCANPEKTNIYMGGVRDDIKKGILQATGFMDGDFPFRYLGVPLNDGKLNKGMFADLLNRVQKALQHWSIYKLSFAGKISWLKSVIFGMEQYWCSTLQIPKEVINLITKFCRNFLWNSEEGCRKLIMKSWMSCCAPYQEGGFNIKEVLAWIKCILGKWIWESDEESGDIQTAKKFLSSCVHQGKLQLHLLYDKFRQCMNPVSWARAVWQRAIQPKNSVFLILAMEKKLATIDQLNCRGIQLVNRCVLCKTDNENHTHLFFKCLFSKEILQKILSWMKISGRTNSLSNEMHWSSNRCTCRHWKTKWFLGCLGAVVHSILEERNARIFRASGNRDANLLPLPWPGKKGVLHRDPTEAERVANLAGSSGDALFHPDQEYSEFVQRWLAYWPIVVSIFLFVESFLHFIQYIKVDDH